MKKIFKNIIVRIITWQARMVLKKYKPKVIAITGSVGKTSTKDAIFTVLSHFKSVRKSEKSFNSEIGIPLTILGLPNAWSNIYQWVENIFRGFLILLSNDKYPEYLVLEVGAGKIGDIKNTAPWIAPDIAVFTRFPDTPVHVEFFGTAEKIIEEKSALAYHTKKNGLLILNHDDIKVYELKDKAHRRYVSYGFDKDSTYKASYPSYVYEESKGYNLPHGITFKLEYDGNVFPVYAEHVIGMHYVSSILIAIACAKEVGCDILESIKYANTYMTPPSRMSLLEGINSSIIIDDTYNSSPVATISALEVLSVLKGKRKIAVLGDMLELGRYTEEAHRDIGDKVVGVADILVVVGPRARFISSQALAKGFKKSNIYEFESSKEASLFLKDEIKKGDIILLKGSQGVRLERTVKDIMAYPQDASKLICRQEKEWEER